MDIQRSGLRNWNIFEIMKRILLFTDSLGAGGAQRQLVGLAVMLQRAGYKVKVCTYHNIDFYKNYLDDNRVENDLIPNAGNAQKRIWAVRQYFKQEKPDWVIAYQETPSLVACAAKVLGCNYKLLVSERNTTQVIGMNERVRFFLYRWADAIVPNSYAQESFLTNHHPWMKTKVTTITNFVDLVKFHVVEHDRSKIPEVLVVATIRPSKNTSGLIMAASILKNKGLNFHISWYGYSDEAQVYYDKCEALIKEYGLAEFVSLYSKTKEIHKKYQEADYFCLPSFYEGTPNVLCEAISCGLPVMVSDVCDNPMYAQPAINGVLFDPNNPEDMADKMASLLGQNEDQYNTYRINSRKIAEEKLSQNVFIEKYLKLLENKE